MKIGIITFHFPYNCGAVLQCAALQTTLENMGHKVYVIDYRPWYHQNRYTPLKNPLVLVRNRLRSMPDDASLFFKFKSVIGAFYRTAASWLHYFKNKPQDDLFRSFTGKHLHTTRLYRTIRQLRRDYPEYDLYIAGSDQLWNAYLTDGCFDEAYFLKFGPESVIKAAYAVGADFETVPDAEDLLPSLLDGLDAVALREKKYREMILRCAPDLYVTTAVDPTLLLGREEYFRFTSEMNLVDEPFIFTYTMPNETQAEIYRAAGILSSAESLKIVDASGQPTPGNRAVPDNRTCGPAEFLWYISHARYVLTNSFHGTAFSVIFEKQFFVIPHSKTGNRATDLLESLGLQDRWTGSGEYAAEKMPEKIDYALVNEKKMKLQQDAFEYLRMCTCIQKK